MAELARKGAKSAKKSQGAVIKEAIFTGVSYMIPVIVGGGVLQGIAKAMGGYDIAQQAAELAYTQFTFAMVLNAIGAAIMNLSVPIIGAYSAYAIAEKPGLAPASPSASSPSPPRRASWAPSWAASSQATSSTG